MEHTADVCPKLFGPSWLSGLRRLGHIRVLGDYTRKGFFPKLCAQLPCLQVALERSHVKKMFNVSLEQ